MKIQRAKHGLSVSQMLGESNLCLWVLILRVNLQRALLLAEVDASQPHSKPPRACSLGEWVHSKSLRHQASPLGSQTEWTRKEIFSLEDREVDDQPPNSLLLLLRESILGSEWLAKGDVNVFQPWHPLPVVRVHFPFSSGWWIYSKGRSDLARAEGFPSKWGEKLLEVLREMRSEFLGVAFVAWGSVPLQSL